jgi:hypothetical protein
MCVLLSHVYLLALLLCNVVQYVIILLSFMFVLLVLCLFYCSVRLLFILSVLCYCVVFCFIVFVLCCVCVLCTCVLNTTTGWKPTIAVNKPKSKSVQVTGPELRIQKGHSFNFYVILNFIVTLCTP